MPSILVSGTLGEELVVEALHTGATDYVLKPRLEALGPAARRALSEAAERRDRTRLEAELAQSQAAMRAARSTRWRIRSWWPPRSGTTTGSSSTSGSRSPIGRRQHSCQANPSILVGHTFRRAMGGFGSRFYDACVGVVETGLPVWRTDSVSPDHTA